MKEKYVAPDLERLLLRPAQSVALLDTELNGGRGEHTIISAGDIDIELEPWEI